jgi:hypothetical protein
MERQEAPMRVITAVVLVWLVIGVAAVIQRGYLGSSSPSCAHLGTVAVTVVAGPLNYLGVNPKVNCKVPQPSS